MAGLALVSIGHMPTGDAAADFASSDPPNTPMGVARGVHQGRVVWVRDASSTNENWYDGCGTCYWEDANTNQGAVAAMMSRALQWLTGRASDPAAWDALFRHFNQSHGSSDVGYRAGDKIAVKINLNNCGSYTAQSNSVDVTPQVVRTLPRQLVRQAGVPEQDITVYDAARYVADMIWTPCDGEFGNVRFADRDGTRGRFSVTLDTAPPICYSDADVPGPDYPPTCVAEARYLISDGVEALKETVVPRGITGSGTDTMTLTFAGGSVVDTWLKIALIASAVAGTQSYPLDGEAAASGAGRGYFHDANVDLLTSDGIAGGNAVFHVGSLRGDFNGDDLVTPEGIDGFFSRYTAGDSEADFWGAGFGATLPDGWVTPADTDGFLSALEEAVAENHGLDPLPAH
jgi:hypothetical protein